MKQTAQKWWRIVWYSVAFFLVFFALLVTLTRLITPQLNAHKATFEKMAEHFFLQPVKMGSIDLLWHGLHPVLRATHVELFTEQQKPFITIQEIRADINFLSSLMHRSLQTDQLRITGVVVTVEQLPHQQYKINDYSFTIPQNKISQNKMSAESGFQDAWYKALVSQRMLTLKNIRILWKKSGEHAREVPLFIKHVVMTHQWDTHTIIGSVVIPYEKPTNIEFGVHLAGDLRTPQKGNILFYAKVTDLLLSPWKYHPAWYGYQLQDAQADGSIWVKWESGHVSFAQSHLTISQARLFSEADSDTLHFEKLSGNFLWKPQGHGWELTADHVRLVTDDYPWPENAFSFRWGQQLQEFWIAHLDLRDVDRIVEGSSLASTPFLKQLKALQPRGELNQLYFKHHGPIDKMQSYTLSTGFLHLSTGRLDKIPGVSNLSGAVQLSPHKGILQLDSQSAVLDFGDLFQKPLSIDQMNGNIQWHQTEDHGWEITGTQLSLSDPYLSVYGEFGLSIPSDGKNPFLSLLAGYALTDSAQAYRYMPSGILPESATHWLDQAFVKGDGGEGSLILHGPLEQFPFAQKEGTFLVDADVYHTTLHYADGWPGIENINAELIFSGHSMNCLANSGQIFQSQIKKAVVEIPYLGAQKEPVLNVEGETLGDAGDLMRFLKESPLSQSIGENVVHLMLSGGAQLNLKLQLPLTELKNSQVNGKVHFNQNELEIPNWKLTFPHLTGDILFTEKTVSSWKLYANLFNVPTELQINTVTPSHSEVPFTRIVLQGNLDMESLKHYFHLTFPAVVSGSASYQATVDLNTRKDGIPSNSLTVVSYLEGVHSELPPPFQKSTTELLPSTLQVNFGNRQDTVISMALGDALSLKARFNLTHSGLKLQNANLRFGSIPAQEPVGSGLFIDGYLKTVDWKAWQSSLDAFKKEATEQSLSLPPLSTLTRELNKVNLRLGEITLLGHRFKNTVLTLVPMGLRGWQIGMNNAEIDGTVNVPDNYLVAGISGTFKRFFIDSSDSRFSENKMKPSQIPPLTLHVDQFRYDQRKLNNIDVSTARTQDALLLKQLTFRSDMLSGTLTGEWRQSPQGVDNSRLTGQLDSDDINQLMKSLAIQPSIQPSKGSVRVNLYWQDPLYRFDVQRLRGQLGVKLGSGRIVRLSESAAAMLNLGSILTSLSIGRLFEMNFSDFSGKGYSFNSASGDLQLNQGKITTTHVAFSGEVADLKMSGTVDTIHKTLAMVLNVIPHLTSSLPVITAVAINPVIGAVTWAAQKVIGKAFDQATSYTYQITGPWKNPTIKLR